MASLKSNLNDYIKKQKEKAGATNSRKELTGSTYLTGKPMKTVSASLAPKRETVKEAVAERAGGNNSYAGTYAHIDQDNALGGEKDYTNDYNYINRPKYTTGLVLDFIKKSFESLASASGAGNAKVVRDLVDSLNKINEKYNQKTDRDYYESELLSELGEEPTYEKKDDIVIDKDKIAEAVTAGYQETREKSEKELGDKYGKKSESLYEKIERLNQELPQELDKISNKYDAYKKNAEYDALKRGMARSTVAELEQDSLEGQKTDALNEKLISTASSVQKLENEIDDLNSELDAALNELDIELASKIQKEIDTKVSKLESEQSKVLAYNKKIDELTKTSLEKRAKKQAKLEEEYAKKYAGKNEEMRNKELVDAAIETVRANKLKPSDVLSNKELASLLGEHFYDVYYEVCKNR